MRIVKTLFKLLIIGLLVLISIAIGYYFAVTKDVSLQPEKLVLSDNALIIYDQHGSPVEYASAFNFKQTAKIEDIPLHTQLAFLQTEDKRFYHHNGFDSIRIVKAAWNNLTSLSFKEGASTISQQLIKNTHLTQEKTLKRKAQEWKLTRQLERKYNKEEILEKYLNSIYFGHNCFGIQSAAQFYFNKLPQELTLADSAILAGLVKSPNNYSPFKNPEKCAQRKNCVLNGMLHGKLITDKEKTEAMNAPMPLRNEEIKENTSYLNFVFDELSTITEEKNLVLSGKIEIFTGLDRNLQAELESLSQENTHCDKMMIVLDSLQGNFKACVSSVGNIRRLPGSIIKPLLVYAPAIEEDILVPATPILDEKVNYNGYAPENYDGKFNGYLSARECVAKSLNIPAVKVLQSLSVKTGVRYLEKLGLKMESEDESLALALGGMKRGFTLRDLAAGYAALQNGIWQNCSFITSLKQNGQSIYKKTPEKRRVFSEESAYLMTDMLKTTTQTGTAKKLRSLPFEIAAKTGTVGTRNGNTDAYTLSYTTKDVVGVWLGNANNQVINYTGGGKPCAYSLHIHEFLYNEYKRTNVELLPFTMPKTVQQVSLDKISYYDTHNMILSDDFAPKEYCFQEVFKRNALPTKKSDFFSNPSISPPHLKMGENSIIITFLPSAPTIYNYKIDRYDYATHTTVYEGGYIKQFKDENLTPNKNYIYTITPSFRGKEGLPLQLPTISTKKILETNDKDILKKDWWKY